MKIRGEAGRAGKTGQLQGILVRTQNEYLAEKKATGRFRAYGDDRRSPLRGAKKLKR